MVSAGSVGLSLPHSLSSSTGITWTCGVSWLWPYSQWEEWDQNQKWHAITATAHSWPRQITGQPTFLRCRELDPTFWQEELQNPSAEWGCKEKELGASLYPLFSQHTLNTFYVANTGLARGNSHMTKPCFLEKRRYYTVNHYKPCSTRSWYQWGRTCVLVLRFHIYFSYFVPGFMISLLILGNVCTSRPRTLQMNVAQCGL